MKTTTRILFAFAMVAVGSSAWAVNNFLPGPVNTANPAVGYAPAPSNGLGEQPAYAGCGGYERSANTRLMTVGGEATSGGRHIQ